MKTFEERYTAWIDGRLAGTELETFEKELEDRSLAEADKLEAQHLGDLLRRHGAAPAITNPDFFNHQLMARIRAEQPKQMAGSSRSFFTWPLMRFASAGLFGIAIGWMLATAFNTGPVKPPTVAKKGQPAYVAQVMETRTDDPNVSASVVHSEQDNVTVLWLDGLEYLPASYNLQ
ncbi:hypothetical protein ACXR0O_20220 [Verrucomicrobiota bacterium sgz303538]